MIAVQEHRVPVYLRVGTLIIPFVIHVINKEIRVFIAHSVIELIELTLIEKWFSALCVASKFYQIFLLFIARKLIIESLAK